MGEPHCSIGDTKKNSHTWWPPTKRSYLACVCGFLRILSNLTLVPNGTKTRQSHDWDVSGRFQVITLNICTVNSICLVYLLLFTINSPRHTTHFRYFFLHSYYRPTFISCTVTEEGETCIGVCQCACARSSGGLSFFCRHVWLILIGAPVICNGWNCIC